MDFKPKASLTYILLVLCTLCVLITCVSSAQYGDHCHTSGDCGEFTCRSGICDCFLNRNDMFYDEELKMCFSLVGKKCSREDDGLLPLRCVPNAECRKSNKLPDTLGYCSCKPRYSYEDSGKRCASSFEQAAPKVTSMDQVRPEGWNRSSSSALFRNELYHYLVVGFITMLVSIFPFR